MRVVPDLAVGVLVRVLVRVLAMPVLVLAAARGYRAGVQPIECDGWIVLAVLTIGSWALGRVALGLALWRRQPASTTGTGSLAFQAAAPATATLLCLPIAYGIGMLDAAQMATQRGCLRTTCAPLLVPVLASWFEFVVWRLRGRGGRISG
jgi:hypothetical protein